MALPLSKLRRVGDTVYLSGELGFAADGSLPEGIAAQTEQTLKNIAATLAGEGLALSDVVSATVYLTDRSDFAAFNEVYRKHFAEPFPARTTLEAPLMIDAKIEITVIAARG
ncbi:reactive intermediate/imine deaminase [Tistlia consotensis]|uniref:Reactive intermediate/imine deaminase n=1 Tax=Tistlia consotensis USBA 355 TaxID=560819 RepID=A0A1Y6CH58_9PROT|nr:RidA family protein [Tistlia consotensis]SMF64154.1 reactive intermediate/imine deaminase [Tistlia consotensis USBA 355]SNR97822.1 reactive intermediate/imine deaminase [Tistlia consotensis]